MSAVLKDPIEILIARLAKLGPKCIRFDIGAGGGGPGLTPQDIAAALGMTPAGVGRDLLEYVWVPGAFSSKTRREALLSRLAEVQLLEHNARETEAVRALFQVAVRGESARHLYNDAQAKRWPSLVAKAEPLEFAKPYTLMLHAILFELSHPRACPVCGGKELTDKKGAPVTCERCGGQGAVEYGPSWRAERLEMKHSSFTQRWQGPFEWLLNRFREEMAEAVSALCRRLH